MESKKKMITTDDGRTIELSIYIKEEFDKAIDKFVADRYKSELDIVVKDIFDWWCAISTLFNHDRNRARNKT